MDAISNTDRFVILLRQKMAERAETKRTLTNNRTESKTLTGHQAVGAVIGRSAKAGAEDEKLRRTVIEQLLANRFGHSLINEAKFQEIIDQVYQVMMSDENLKNLFNDVVFEIKSGLKKA
jgi:hypothetical protein